MDATPEWQNILDALEAEANQLLKPVNWFLFELDQNSEQSPLLVLRATTAAQEREIYVPLSLEALAGVNRAIEVPLGDGPAPERDGLDPLIQAVTGPEDRTVLVAPLQYREKLAGCLVGCSGRSEPFSPAELAAFGMLASYAALAVENSRLRVESLFRLSEVMSLQLVSSALVEEPNLEAILTLIIDEAVRVTNARMALVLLLEEGGQTLLVRARKGHQEAGLKSGRLSVEDSLNGLVVKTGQPLVSHNALTDPRANQARAHRLGVQTVAIAPLRIRDRTIGTIAVHNKQDGYFSRSDVDVLCSFANQAAIAIDNARLFSELLLARDEIEQKAQELQTLLAQIMRVQEDERQRIASDIHDRAVSLIVAALYELEACAPLCPADAAIHTQIDLVQDLLNEAIEKTRTAIYNLWPATLEQIGLVPALRELLSQQEKTAGFPHRLRVYGSPYEEWTAPTQVTIYRILQEALHNIHKHAGASLVEMSIHFDSQPIRLIVRDNGRGFDTQSVPLKHHLGLLTMRERARTIGGQLYIHSAPAEGCQVVLEIPKILTRQGRDRLQVPPVL